MSADAIVLTAVLALSGIALAVALWRLGDRLGFIEDELRRNRVDREEVRRLRDQHKQALRALAKREHWL